MPSDVRMTFSAATREIIVGTATQDCCIYLEVHLTAAKVSVYAGGNNAGNVICPGGPGSWGTRSSFFFIREGQGLVKITWNTGDVDTPDGTYCVRHLPKIDSIFPP